MAVLQKPVWWSRNEVQVVILTVVGSEEDPKLEKFCCKTVDRMILHPADFWSLLGTYGTIMDFAEDAEEMRSYNFPQIECALCWRLEMQMGNLLL